MRPAGHASPPRSAPYRRLFARPPLEYRPRLVIAGVCRSRSIISASRAGGCPWRHLRPRSALTPLLGGDAESFGMGPAVVLGQHPADVAWLVGDGAVAELAAGNRQLGDSHRE